MVMFEKIADIVAKVFRLDVESVRMMSGDDSLGSIGLDSINCMELVIYIEESFDVAFQDEDLLLDNLDTMDKLCGIVERKLETSKAKV